MKSSVWRAAGNTYVVVSALDASLTADEARRLAGDTDGVLEVLDTSNDRIEIVIWNPDGSQAELSGNGTRIAAAWLAGESGADRIEVVVGERSVATRALESGEFEQEVGEVVVGDPETIHGISFIPVSVGNPHAVVVGDPESILEIGPLLETHPRFPNRTNVQVARIDADGEATARVWERGVGETASSGTSAVAVAAATHPEGEVLVHFPGGDLRVRLEGGRALLYGSAERVT